MSEEKRSYLMGAIRHYRSLFAFPAYSSLVLATVATALLGCVLAFIIGTHSVASLFSGLLFAVIAFSLPMIGLDIVMSRSVTKSDPILDLRRMAALTLGTTVLWMVILNFWAIIQTSMNSLGLVRGFFFGVSATCSFRILVLRCVSPLKKSRLCVVAFLPPIASGSVASIWLTASPRLLAVTVSTLVLLTAAAWVFVYLVNQHGKSSVGIGAIDLFKAFLANWILGVTSPLEGYFEKMGRETDIVIKLLGFAGGGVPKATIVVPNVHPGPFKNLGSSNLPWEIQRTLQMGASPVVMVPHGACGHELDVTSQAQNKRILDAITGLADFQHYSSEASKMVRVNVGEVSATCQFMGGVALVTVTCAPASMEDIPLEVGTEIVNNGKALGAEEVMLIDAHNSIGGTKEVPILTKAQLRGLTSAASSAIECAFQLKRYPFTLGASQSTPKEFGIAEGIGRGGITTAVVDVEGQKMAYAVIDGNNMVSGLREKILESISDLVDDAEVLTTDTHAVNAVSSVERGYFPVGESIDQKRFLSYIRDSVISARERALVSSVGYRDGVVRGVRVIGEAKLRSISLLVDSALLLSKRLVAVLYLPAIVVSILLFVIL